MKIEIPAEILMKGMVDYIQSHPGADMDVWSDGVLWLKNLIENSSTIETEFDEPQIQNESYEEQVPTEFDTQDRYSSFLNDISSNYGENN